MKNKNIGYLLKEGVRGVFLHGFMSFAAICVTLACLVLIGSFYLVMLNVNNLISELDKQNQIIAFVDDSYTEAQAKSIGTQINRIEAVTTAEFVSNEQAFSSFVNDFDNPDVFDGISSDLLRHRYVITLSSSEAMSEVAAAVEAIPGIAKVNAEQKIAEGFSTTRGILQIVSTVLSAILLIVSLFIISNTVKLAMYDRKDEIAIMKMVGATNGFIRFPFVVEGFFIGVLSAAFAFFAEWGIYNIMCEKIESISGSSSLLSLISFNDVLPVMVITYLATGLLVGIFGSLMSIRKFLNV